MDKKRLIYMLAISIFCFININIYADETSGDNQITLLFAGDAMQHDSQIRAAYNGKSYDYSECFVHLKEEISSADISFVNFEASLGGKPYKGYPMFSAPDQYAFALKDIGFDVFLTANNHIVDRGNRGLIRTIAILDSMQVYHTGVFRNEHERSRKYPLFIEENGIRFAILNYTYGTNGLFASAPLLVNYIDHEQIEKDIAKAKEGKADIIIANMHWGNEYEMRQNIHQKNTAQFLVDHGVDLVIGSHPHVVQPSVTIPDEKGNISNLIVYSLGNFVSGMVAPNTDGGQIVKVILEKDSTDVRIKSAEYALIYRHKEVVAGKLKYQVIPVSLTENISYPILDNKAIVLSKAAQKQLDSFAKSARKILRKYNVNVPEYSFEERKDKEETKIKAKSFAQQKKLSTFAPVYDDMPRWRNR